MGLDIHVMPLWKFFAGDYESPLEKRKSILGLPVVRAGSPKGDLPVDGAIKAVAGIQKRLKKRFGIHSTWSDEGESVFSEQFDFRSWHALRAFAADQDYPVLHRDDSYFEEEDPTGHPGIRKIWRGAASAYKHLVLHDDHQGYYFPVRFEKPLLLDRDSGVIAGSSCTLQAELAKLGEILKIDKPWSNLLEREIAEDDTLQYVKYGWLFMYHCTTLSVNRQLPIIFDG